MQKVLIPLFLALLLCFSQIEAGYSPYLKDWTAGRFTPQMSAHEHFDQGSSHFSAKEWKEAIPHFMAIVLHFPDSDFRTDALYCAAVCYYFRAELDLANRYFSEYLESQGALHHFERALTYKFYIAEGYANGFKRHLLNRRWMPPIVGAYDKAIGIYDEVIAALVDNDIAVRALYGKAQLLRKQKKYHESIEAFKSLVHRYEIHELAEMSFLQISEIYLARAPRESQNPDLLALAELNMKAFRSRFPSSPQLREVEKNFAAMEEEFGKSLLETANFYERKAKPKAAQIYLDELSAKYPHSEVAKVGREKVAS